VPDRPATGRSLVTRRAIVDIVRGAVLGSYGVTGVDAGLVERLLGRLGFREPGIRVRLDRGLEIDLHLTVAYGVPVAEVARQVDSAVRYGIRRALDREVRRLAVHVGGLRYQPASVPPTKESVAPRSKDATPGNGHPGDQPASSPMPGASPNAEWTPGSPASSSNGGDPSLRIATSSGEGPAEVAGRGRRRRRPPTDGRDPG
jgi:uncharacterized alkaline shock family protein YloU